MRWFKVQNDSRVQPEAGRYTDWKEQIAIDCARQCVYCAITEGRFGGIRNFHVEHYRPKSHREFEDLENVITNLYYACSICNGFKGADWPDEPAADHSVAAYPDPGESDYNELIQVDQSTFEVSSDYPAATYMIERVFLNRPQLLLERRLSSFCAWASAARRELTKLAPHLMASAATPARNELLESVFSALSQTADHVQKLLTASPYAAADIRR